MQITHEEARRLIQFRADNSLDAARGKMLKAHLEGCTECRNYLKTVNETEAVLRRTLQKEWDAQPLPLQMAAIHAKINSRTNMNTYLTTRTALVGIAFMMFAIIAWQSISSGVPTSQQNLPGNVPLIPTPATQYTETNIVQNDCTDIEHIIREGDSLESIARQYSVSMESIRVANDLTDETLGSARELVIPSCKTSPTSTTHPPTFTITPTFETITTTPG